MPDQPSWIERVPAILQALENAPPFLDRESIARLLGVSARQANRFMQTCPEAYAVGRSHLVPRQAMLDRMRQLQRSGSPQRERQRQIRLSEVLADARVDRLRARIAIPVKPEALGKGWEALPAGVMLEPGLLQISFQTPLELVEKLFLLSQAISHDFNELDRLTQNHDTM